MSALPFFEPEPELDDGPQPDWDTATLNEAIEWHLYRQHRWQRKLAEIEAETDRMVERYRQWAAKKAEPLHARLQWSEDTVKSLVARQIDEHPDGPKMFRLPSGVVRSSAGRTRVEVDDLEAFEGWVHSQADPSAFASWLCKPDRAALKRHVETSGELVPGVRLEEQGRSVTITLEVDEQESNRRAI